MELVGIPPLFILLPPPPCAQLDALAGLLVENLLSWQQGLGSPSLPVSSARCMPTLQPAIALAGSLADGSPRYHP
eukprot:3702-Amorphochlora_amoeboformis.AAC.2